MPMQRFAQQLVGRLERVHRWPPRREEDLWEELSLWIALRDSNKAILAAHTGRDADRYMVDPLPKLISNAYSDLLFSRPPEILAADEGDQDQMDEMIEENNLPSELKLAARDQSAEGEIWWRIFSDPEVADWPLIEWHSRLGVIPLWVGKKLRAVAFFTRLDDLTENDTKSETMQAYRHVELHEPGWVHNLLYEGRRDSLGKRVDLARHPDTKFLREEWNHDCDQGRGMLAGWIPNDVDITGRKGVSDYSSIQDLLLELNESLETGKTNRRLVARKRLAGPPSALQENGQFDPENEFIVIEQSDLPGDGAGRGGVMTIEYSFDAEALTHWMDNVAIKALTRIGMAAEFVGVSNDASGSAESGVHLRLKLIPTTNAGEGKGTPFDSQVPKILKLMAQVSALDSSNGGFGATWRNTDDLPTFVRSTALPEDRVERVTRLTTAVTGQIMSRQTAIREDHPDWDDERVEQELTWIDEDNGIVSEDESTDDGPTLFAGNIPSDRGGDSDEETVLEAEDGGVGGGEAG